MVRVLTVHLRIQKIIILKLAVHPSPFAKSLFLLIDVSHTVVRDVTQLACFHYHYDPFFRKVFKKIVDKLHF